MDIIVGGRPSDLRGWKTVNGSTRTYSLMVDNMTVFANSSGYGVFRVWAWQLASWTTLGSSILPRMYRICVYDNEGRLVAYAMIPVTRTGVYYQVLMQIKLRPGTYKLVVKFPVGEKVLGVPLRVTKH